MEEEMQFETESTTLAQLHHEEQESVVEQKTQTQTTYDVSDVPGNYFVFDLETVPDLSRIDQFDLEPLPDQVGDTPYESMMPPAEFVKLTVPDQKKHVAGTSPPEGWIEQCMELESGSRDRKGAIDLLAKLSEKKNQYDQAVRKRLKKMATTPEMCRIVSMAWLFNGKISGAVVDEASDESEREILDLFWLMVSEQGVIPVGFNIVGFDLPVILIRSAILGVIPTRHIRCDRYSNDVIDLFLKRFPGGFGDMGLKSLARAMGIPIPAKDVDGSAVYQLWQEGKRQEILEYNMSDVKVTADYLMSVKGYLL